LPAFPCEEDLHLMPHGLSPWDNAQALLQYFNLSMYSRMYISLSYM
jgi:hypothetical protein